jgi:hypothetical protein
VRHAVDAARQPRDDHIAGRSDVAREVAGELGAGSRALTRADDLDRRPVQQLAASPDVEQRRRRIERGKRAGIAGLDREQRLGARCACPR